jgi:hypothetical protein
MTTRHASELLYDSEAALRLVDSAIEDIRDADPRRASESAAPAPPNAFRDLRAATSGVSAPEILARSYDEVVSMLGSLREHRDAMQRTVGEDTDGISGADLAARRLDYAGAVLTELESRLAHLATVLDAAKTPR